MNPAPSEIENGICTQSKREGTSTLTFGKLT